MKIRRCSKDVELSDGESIATAAVSVGIFDDDGNLQRIVAGVKYVVSGDCGSYFVKPKPRKKEEEKDDDSISP